MADPNRPLANRWAPAAAGEASVATSVLGWMLLLLALTLAFVLWRHQPSAPLAVNAPATEFSGIRAQAELRQLLGNGEPHPVGSAADDALRQRILATLIGLGYQVKTEEGFACHWTGACARVRNIVARFDGRESVPAVGLAAHYDSVPAGPGASDDMASVAAILEIARALKAGPPHRYPIELLIDEGEETGLLGATAFEESSPETQEIRAVVNLDARGTSGPSYMFETSGDDGWLVRAWAAGAVRPVTSSLAAFIYSLLPNDTDLTVFRDHHVSGIDFAFIGGATRYHTPADSYANCSPASLQHQGENAFAAVRGLADSTVAAPPAGKLVFFDLAGLTILYWPLGWTLGLAITALLGILVVIGVGMRRGTLSGADLALGVLAVPAAAILTAMLAYCLELALVAGGPLRALWLAHPLPANAAFWLLPLAAVAGLALLLGRRSGSLGLWAGVWLAWSLAGVALAALAPAASYIFVAPSLVAAVLGLAGMVWRGRRAATSVAVVVSGLAAALLWFGVVPTFYVGLGVTALPIISICVALVCTSIVPVVAAGGHLGRWLWLVALLLTLGAVLAALPQERFTAFSPQPLTYAFYQDADLRQAHWLEWSLVPVPAAVEKAAAFGGPGPAFPWSSPRSQARSAVAPVLDEVASPELQVLSSQIVAGKRHLHLRLLSHRGAPSASVYIPASARIESVLVEGHAVPGPQGKKAALAAGRGWLSFGEETLPAGGCNLDLVLGETRPLDWYVADRTAGLPPSGYALLQARPANAAPQHEGDITVISHKVRI